MFVKGNQSGLLEQAKHFLPEDFSPENCRLRPGTVASSGVAFG